MQAEAQVKANRRRLTEVHEEMRARRRRLSAFSDAAEATGELNLPATSPLRKLQDKAQGRAVTVGGSGVKSLKTKNSNTMTMEKIRQLQQTVENEWTEPVLDKATLRSLSFENLGMIIEGVFEESDIYEE